MPNAPVPANAGGMPKFDRGQIMRGAWASYCRMMRTCCPSTVKGRRQWFADCLRGAWEAAKRAAVEAVKTPAQHAADRVEEIKRQMHALDMRSFRFSITEERKALVAELRTLETV